ncbi:hypothetical protein J3R30DRAFT_3694238 [Lentinula aciculospora]|uniref:Uncharacterized protein n=1 Tax=Lentinula aciculospora TaxID=153920 RepID=A0A9W9AWY8_9AGAR|nr:hypothetical protein J3R30DRAFT_3694238 [Lentinula aciculospora]
MGVKLNPKNELAQIFVLDADSFVLTVLGIISKVQSEEPMIHENLAPSFGDSKASESVKELDNEMKVAVFIVTNGFILNLRKHTLSWVNIQGCFNQNTSLVADSSPTEVVKEYFSETSADFKFDGSPDPSLVQKVMTWWEGQTCPDPDIRNDSKLDIDSLAKIVAWSGATVTDFWNFWSKHE